MSQKVTVIGPNLRDQSKGTFHVHAAGCADIARQARRDRAFEDGWTIDATSIEEIVQETYPPEDFEWDPADAGDRAMYRADFHLAPCVRLPEGVS